MTPRGQTPPLSIAPMMDRTDRHYRYLMRLITRHTLLYTEMVTTAALLNSDPEPLLAFDPAEHPISLQLGGSDPRDMARCAVMAETLGYDEVNINIGCPSSRVQSGRFGACLMAQPALVAELVVAMREAVAIPVTVKHRIGIDEIDQYDHMLRFVDTVAAAGADRFSVHARKAWLSGLSPKQNRNVPPLRHEEIHRLKRERPQLSVEINGGIVTLDSAQTHLEHLDAVMIGRAAFDQPYMFADADQRFFGSPGPSDSPEGVVAAYKPYVQRMLENGHPMSLLLRPLFSIFSGVPGARRWRRTLTEKGFCSNPSPDVLDLALRGMQEVQTQMANDSVLY